MAARGKRRAGAAGGRAALGAALLLAASSLPAAPAPAAAPTGSAGGPYKVYEGASVVLRATGTDPDGQSLRYAWDLNGDGAFETSGASVRFSAAGLAGPST